MVAPPAAEIPTTAAFFDLDNTILRGASVFYFAREMYRRDFFGFGDLTRMLWMQIHFMTVGENLDHIRQIRDRALGIIAGHSAAEVRRIGEDVYDDVMADKIWPAARDLVRQHLAAGEQVWLVTATPLELAETVAKRLGLTGALGTISEQVNGVYTGKLIGEPLHGPAKATAVQELAVRQRLDLSRSAAYSDSAHDLPMLQLVGRPCAMNPDARLRAHARAAGWQVQDFRTVRKVAKVATPMLGAALGGLAVAAHRRKR
jgi:HAD superfamily hydrolase (TIGR01490 family)